MSDPLATSGIVVIDKPQGLTSHDVVARLRRAFGTRKVGHAGTLDPMATGVLVVGIERGTKLLAHLVAETKTYEATIRLGATTTTDDAEGEVVSTSPTDAVTDADIIDAIDSFRNEALDTMATTIGTLEGEVSKSQEYLARVRQTDERRAAGSLDLGQ